MISFILFILALPVAAAVAHDVYFTYIRMEQDNITFPEALQWSDLGWLWVEYAPGSYDWVHKTINPAFWDTVLLPLLEQTAAFVSALPFAIVTLYLLLAYWLGLWPFTLSARKAKKSSYAFDRVDGPKGRIKYKRR